MSTSGEAADQTVKLSLDGAETIIRLSGDGAKNLAKLLASLLSDIHSDRKLTKGKLRLREMLKSGKKLEVYTMPDSRLEDFCREAKNYGVSYTVLKDKSEPGKSEIMVKTDDRRRIDYIYKKLHINPLDAFQTSSVTPEHGKNRAGEPLDIDEFVRLFSEKAENAGVVVTGVNPQRARAAERGQSVRSSERAGRETTPPTERPSVRLRLADIHAEQAAHSGGEVVRQTAKKVKNAAR